MVLGSGARWPVLRSGVATYVASALLTFASEIGVARAQNPPSGIVSACSQTPPPPSALSSPGRKVGPLIPGGPSFEVDLDKPVLSHIRRGMNFLRAGDHDRALEEFDQAIKLDARSSMAFLGRAQVHSEKRKHDLAIRDADQAIKLFPSNAAAYLALGTAYINKYDHRRAIESLDQAIKLDPTCSFSFMNRGEAYELKGDHDRAIADFNRVIDFDPPPADASRLVSRGYAYLMTREYEKAMVDLNKALKLDPRNPFAFYNRCGLRIIIGALDEAMADCGEASRIRPDVAPVLDSLALIYLRKGAFDDAITNYDAALRNDAKHAYSLYGRGLARRMKGEVAGGEADIAAAKAIYPRVSQYMVRYGLKE
jgi:tetratricopeptide (TPR) repeat protein